MTTGANRCRPNPRKYALHTTGEFTHAMPENFGCCFSTFFKIDKSATLQLKTFFFVLNTIKKITLEPIA